MKLSELALLLCQEIESLPASQQQTKVSVLASELRRLIVAEELRPDPLGEALNSGNGTYKP